MKLFITNTLSCLSLYLLNFVALISVMECLTVNIILQIQNINRIFKFIINSLSILS